MTLNLKSILLRLFIILTENPEMSYNEARKLAIREIREDQKG